MTWVSPQHIVAVCGLVTNEIGDLLLVKSERRGWELPGGQVEEGETIIQALHREIMEESGVTVTIGNLAVVNTNLSNRILILGFHAQYIQGDLTTSDETIDVQWVKPDKILSVITHQPNRLRVQDMLATEQHIVYRAYTSNPFQIVETQQIGIKHNLFGS